MFTFIFVTTLKEYMFFISGRTRQDIITKALTSSREVLDTFVGFYQNLDILGLFNKVP
jgi:hypothetical protein